MSNCHIIEIPLLDSVGVRNYWAVPDYLEPTQFIIDNYRSAYTYNSNDVTGSDYFNPSSNIQVFLKNHIVDMLEGINYAIHGNWGGYRLVLDCSDELAILIKLSI